MTFPTQYPLFQFLFWLLNTSGIGGVFVGLLGAGLLLTAFLSLRWIKGGQNTDEREVYAYPTPALHDHHEPALDLPKGKSS